MFILMQAMYKSNRGTITGYFLAGRFMTFIPVSMKIINILVAE